MRYGRSPHFNEKSYSNNATFVEQETDTETSNCYPTKGLDKKTTKRNLIFVWIHLKLLLLSFKILLIHKTPHYSMILLDATNCDFSIDLTQIG